MPVWEIFMGLDFVVIGDVNIETEIEARKKPASREYLISKITGGIEGDAIDIAITGSHFGLKPAIVTSIGSDARGILEILDRYNIDYSHMMISEGKTGKTFLIRTQRKTSSFFFPGANRNLLVSSIDFNFLDQSKLVHICSIRQDIRNVMAQKLRKSIFTCQLDMETDLKEVGSKINILFSRSDVASNYTGEKDARKATRKLAALGPKAVIVNERGKRAHICRGEQEMVVEFKEDKTYDASLFFVSFVSGFISRFLKTSNYKSSTSFGLAYQYFASVARKKIVFREAYDIEGLMYKILRLNR
ncbi:MAG: carbohydrate kinase family protein [Candidatus Methanofastidiosia archaeon]